MECFGIPLHAWSRENFTKIGEQWGTVVFFDNGTSNFSDFSSVKILMDSCYYPFIQGSVYLSVDGSGFDVYVKEIDSEINLWDFSTQKNGTQCVTGSVSEQSSGTGGGGQSLAADEEVGGAQSSNAIINYVDQVMVDMGHQNGTLLALELKRSNNGIINNGVNENMHIEECEN